MNNTLVKGLAVLELLSRAQRPLTLTHIGQELGIVKSNVHRLMQGLVESGFVLRDPASGNYSASIKLWELGSAVLGKLDLRRHAERQMEELMLATGESVHLSVLDGSEVVYVHKVDSANPVRAYTQIGGRAPAHCVATGKAQLAHVPPTRQTDVAANLQRHTDRTIVDAQAFLRELGKIRQKGYALNREEWREGVSGIAAPILDSRGAVIAAIGLSGPAMRFRKNVLAPWAESVVAAANDIGFALAGQQPNALLARIGVAPRSAARPG